MASIPDHVFHDLNYRTFRRYIDDPTFRQALLSDPAGTNTREGLGLSEPTINLDQRSGSCAWTREPAHDAGT